LAGVVADASQRSVRSRKGSVCVFGLFMVCYMICFLDEINLLTVE
jgi:hypothetical protein